MDPGDSLSIPDQEWYCDLSVARGVNSRCPFAALKGCPRYYQSVSLLGQAGSTPIQKKEDRSLLRLWKKSDLWPRTAEYATAIAGRPEEPSHFMNFCPEVVFDQFGYFASSLHRHADEIDVSLAHRRLASNNTPIEHWGWAWSLVTPMHYTDCPLFSPLRLRADLRRSSKPSAWSRYGVPILISIAATVVGGLILAFILG